MRKQDVRIQDIRKEDLRKEDLRKKDLRKQDPGFDFDRYHRLLTEADDEPKRWALIELLIEEKARERLAAQRASDRAAMTAHTIATVLKNGRN